ncbi:hypothetical protein KJ644_04625 [Candidatus Dependentiae bacterium]|nr:hypothetical protein [Candidatus Dependentiae bacterium]MBU4387724.1 hypothetical protein [Candidatus Dependentiae bacterium]MCG2755981.1 hypothetical protein [Candidatus Dependentiae bacterium]
MNGYLNKFFKFIILICFSLSISLGNQMYAQDNNQASKSKLTIYKDKIKDYKNKIKEKLPKIYGAFNKSLKEKALMPAAFLMLMHPINTPIAIKNILTTNKVAQNYFGKKFWAALGIQTLFSHYSDKMVDLIGNKMLNLKLNFFHKYIITTAISLVAGSIITRSLNLSPSEYSLLTIPVITALSTIQKIYI